MYCVSNFTVYVHPKILVSIADLMFIYIAAWNKDKNSNALWIFEYEKFCSANSKQEPLNIDSRSA